jgi:hypothetical protein
MHISRCVIVQVCDDLRVAFGQSSIACTARARNLLNYIDGSKFPGYNFCLFVSRSVIDHDQLIWCALQLGDTFEAFPQKSWPIPGTDDNRGSHI